VEVGVADAQGPSKGQSSKGTRKKAKDDTGTISCIWKMNNYYIVGDGLWLTCFELPRFEIGRLTMTNCCSPDVNVTVRSALQVACSRPGRRWAEDVVREAARVTQDCQ
jgi:hypothetical protein